MEPPIVFVLMSTAARTGCVRPNVPARESAVAPPRPTMGYGAQGSWRSGLSGGSRWRRQ
jgi:hypothetical protein